MTWYAVLALGHLRHGFVWDLISRIHSNLQLGGVLSLMAMTAPFKYLVCLFVCLFFPSRLFSIWVIFGSQSTGSADSSESVLFVAYMTYPMEVPATGDVRRMRRRSCGGCWR